MDKVNVILLDREQEIIEDMSVYEDNADGNALAERQFIRYCEDKIANFEGYSEEDKQACIEDGYEQNPKWKIMIHHS